jgi:hypothetical protein
MAEIYPSKSFASAYTSLLRTTTMFQKNIVPEPLKCAIQQSKSPCWMFVQMDLDVIDK